MDRSVAALLECQQAVAFWQPARCARCVPTDRKGPQRVVRFPLVWWGKMKGLQAPLIKVPFLRGLIQVGD